ncbi:unnamed protein product [Paramecium sonneborni]|uniref:Uncharacterized protein n=1 Tax=Paramecium sonneborni TaxID=65129 RepID=A0A8S1RA30_9CILI|nr:unnamed protein product [Paramecium sonneborni]
MNQKKKYKNRKKLYKNQKNKQSKVMNKQMHIKINILKLNKPKKHYNQNKNIQKRKLN